MHEVILRGELRVLLRRSGSLCRRCKGQREKRYRARMEKLHRENDAEKQEQKTALSQLSGTRGPKPLELDWRPWADLYMGILEPIASRLSLSDCIRLPAVCKNWQAVNIPRRSRVEPPWFVSLNTTSGVFTLFDTSCARTYTINSPDLIGATIQSSKSGWLLLSKFDGRFIVLFFFNPLTGEKIWLPSSGLERLDVAAFSASPTSECVVCLLGIDIPCLFVSILVYTRRQDRTVSWRHHTVFDFHAYLMYQHAPVFAKGHMYLTSYGGNVIAFDLESMLWSEIKNPIVRNPWAERHNYTYVAGLGNEVLLVSVPAPNRPVQVLRVDTDFWEMDEIARLGDKALFVSPKGAILTRMDDEGMANRIHYPVLGPSCRCEGMGSYSLEHLQCDLPIDSSLPMEITRFLAAGRNSSWAWIETEPFMG